MTTVPAEMQLGDARDWLRERVDEGAGCPCCGQYAKVYRRAMTATTARTMIAMYRVERYRLNPNAFAHVPTLLRTYARDVAHQGGYATLAQHWGLIEEERRVREDGGRAGWWRLTPAGFAFVRDTLRVPKYVRLYDGRVLSHDDDEGVGIRDVLGKRFNYNDLMVGV